MIKKYKNVEVIFKSSFFDIEINDEFLKFAEESGVDIEHDEELVHFYLAYNFEEYVDLLQMEDFDFKGEI